MTPPTGIHYVSVSAIDEHSRRCKVGDWDELAHIGGPLSESIHPLSTYASLDQKT